MRPRAAKISGTWFPSLNFETKVSYWKRRLRVVEPALQSDIYQSGVFKRRADNPDRAARSRAVVGNPVSFSVSQAVVESPDHQWRKDGSPNRGRDKTTVFTISSVSRGMAAATAPSLRIHLVQ